jgi:hypothetical protein
MHPNTVIQAVHLIQRRRDAETGLFVYVTFPALSKSGPCDECLENETQEIYTEDEITAEFEYAEKEGESWLPKVHPNCVCKMFPYEEAGVKRKLSDEEFDDWLSGLLSAGYIAAEVYDLIVARRKQKKEQQKL